MKTINEVKSDIVNLAKDVYQQGFDDREESPYPCFEDGFEIDVLDQINEIFEEIGIDADRLEEIITAEKDGRLAITPKDEGWGTK